MVDASIKTKKHGDIKEALRQVFSGIEMLRATFEGKRKFTIDGRLVGDIGEVIAELNYKLKIDEKSRSEYDAETEDGRLVQIKATFKDSLTFSTTTGLYLGFKLFEDGGYQEIYNGPAKMIYEHYKHRKDIGEKLLSFPIKELRELNGRVEPNDRVRRKKELHSETDSLTRAH